MHEDPVANPLFQLIRGDASQEGFLELRFRSGIQAAFAYHSLFWINLDNANGVIDMDFQGITISIEGRGLKQIFEFLKLKKISWIRESDTEMEDNKSAEIFISRLTITPPAEFGADGEEEEEAA